MLTSKDFVSVLIVLVILIIVIVQRHSGKSSRHATTPPPALKSGTESDVNKDRRLGVSNIHTDEHNYSPPPAVHTDWTPVDFAHQ